MLVLAPGAVHPFPRLVSLKNEAIAAMQAEVSDRARFGPMMHATPKRDIAHLIPPPEAIARMEEPARPALLLFPRFGFAPEVRSVGKGEAFMRLTQASTNYVALGEAGFEALHRFVGRVPALALDYPDGAAGIEAVEQVWADLP